MSEYVVSNSLLYKLSIIIPYYNSGATIERLLNSIMSEANDVQVIVVDDNSTESAEVFETLKRNYSGRVEFYINDSGVKGAGAARNVGLKHAEGKYLIFADSDDYFISGWKAIVDEYLGSDPDIVVFNPVSWDSVRNRPGYIVKEFSNAVIRAAEGEPNGNLCVRYLFTPAWSKLIKREIVTDNNIVFQETLFSNDVMFSMKSSFYANDVRTDKRNIYCIVERDGSLTKNRTEEAFRIRFDVFYDRIKFLKANLSEEEYAYVADSVSIFCFIRIIYENRFSRKLRNEFFEFCKENGISVDRRIRQYRHRKFETRMGRIKSYIKRVFLGGRK